MSWSFVLIYLSEVCKVWGVPVRRNGWKVHLWCLKCTWCPKNHILVLIIIFIFGQVICICHFCYHQTHTAQLYKNIRMFIVYVHRPGWIWKMKSSWMSNVIVTLSYDPWGLPKYNHDVKVQGLSSMSLIRNPQPPISAPPLLDSPFLTHFR